MHLASPADPEVPRRFEAYCSENTSIPNKKEQRRKQDRTDVPPQTETLYLYRSSVPTALALCYCCAKTKYLARPSVVSSVFFLPNSFSLPSLCLPAFHPQLDGLVHSPPCFFILHLQTCVCQGSLYRMVMQLQATGVLWTRVCASARPCECVCVFVCSRKRRCLSIFSLHMKSRPVRCGAQ